MFAIKLCVSAALRELYFRKLQIRQCLFEVNLCSFLNSPREFG